MKAAYSNLHTISVRYKESKEMAYIKEYWDNKESRAKKAQEHSVKMGKAYENEIRSAIKATKVYDGTVKCSGAEDILDTDTKIVVEELDTVSAACKYSEGRVAMLNFASYKNPGGAFLNGSKAQEECLCHESFLYNVLDAFRKSYYAWNNEHKNKALYLNRALFTPGVVFNHDRVMFKCDVITCAAPNKSTAQKYQNVSDGENTKVLKSRIKFVLDIAKDNSIETLILGAYGCGVFGQDAMEVASIFKEYLNTTHKCFKTVIFAIPGGRDKNLDAFRKVFNNK